MPFVHKYIYARIEINLLRAHTFYPYLIMASSFVSVFKSLKIVEVIVLVIFLLYLIFPVYAPDVVANTIDSCIGMIVVFCVALFLFIYANPVVAVLFVFVAYELLRRSAQNKGRVAYVQYTPSQEKRDEELVKMNRPVNYKTLEENVVAQMAPIGHGSIVQYTESTFKPMADKVHGASLV